MAGRRPVRVGDVYHLATIRFEVTAFDTTGREPIAIGIETCGMSKEASKSVALLAQFWRLISGGEGQAIEVDP